MDADIITLIWLAAGLLLIGIELFAPGLVLVFLGMGALLTAGLRFIGVIESLPASVGTFLASSVAMVFGLRGVIQKWFPPDDFVEEDDEAMAAYGKIVEVIEDVSEATAAKPEGRIRYEGTTWPAATTEGVLNKGARARLVYRKDHVWIVEVAPEALALAAESADHSEEKVPVAPIGTEKDGENP